jgi:hypothetical protein
VAIHVALVGEGQRLEDFRNLNLFKQILVHPRRDDHVGRNEGHHR